MTYQHAMRLKCRDCGKYTRFVWNCHGSLRMECAHCGDLLDTQRESIWTTLRLQLYMLKTVEPHGQGA